MVPTCFRVEIRKIKEKICHIRCYASVMSKVMITGGDHIIFFLFLKENIICGYS